MSEVTEQIPAIMLLRRFLRQLSAQKRKTIRCVHTEATEFHGLKILQKFFIANLMMLIPHLLIDKVYKTRDCKIMVFDEFYAKKYRERINFAHGILYNQPSF